MNDDQDAVTAQSRAREVRWRWLATAHTGIAAGHLAGKILGYASPNSLPFSIRSVAGALAQRQLMVESTQTRRIILWQQNN
jgi:ABC-type xylose transport system permease subunit